MNYAYRPAAAADIDRAYAWYEKERKELGEEFLAEVYATARLVLERPEAYPVVVRQTRRALVHRFPYGLFYRILGDTVVFVACFHTSRNPALWKRRS
ncbi:MAG TPA: type II toxin-antitoxin system RelE/ParE family toxin [Thermoanaerobaculia bacterium]|nr:type II toxin-antitoxin system RelE/ParE family toxin [Thermoanaerobaculia bacterium]